MLSNVTEELKKAIKFSFADFIAVEVEGKKPVTVEIVRLTTG